MIKHKPSLVAVVEQKKICEYSEIEQESENSRIITYILSLLGIANKEGEDRSLHYLAVDQFILEELNRYTYAEIKEAFKMAVKGDFTVKEKGKDVPFKLIYKLDCLVLAEVMRLYEIQKKIILANYNRKVAENKRKLEEEQNQLSDEDKENIVLGGLKKSYEFYQKKGFITNRSYLYDYLFEKDLLPKDIDTKNAVLKLAKERVEARKKLSISVLEKAEYDIITNLNAKVIVECKYISLERFYVKFATFKQLLNGLAKKS